MVVAALFLLGSLAGLQSGEAFAQEEPSSPWKPLEEDGLHSPGSPAMKVLQDPSEAMTYLPRAPAGNHVDWVKALEMELIEPQARLDGEGRVEVIRKEVLITDTGSGDYVLFPHKAHTIWTGCAGMCHDGDDGMFAKEVDGTPMSMFKILQGQYCGRCHGAVAFPLTECSRCHNTPPSSVETEVSAR